MTPADARAVLPPHQRGMAIGLYGGSFNPPHAAHVQASLLALKRLGLDRVWWLVTPGNPLKSAQGLAPLGERLAAARRIIHHPAIVATGVEAALGARYTYDAIRAIKARAPGVRFVWIMGADNLAQFHRWQHWRAIAGLCPIAVVDRPGLSLRSLAGRAAVSLKARRIAERDAMTLSRRRPPAWAFLHGLKSPLSSTALRANRSNV